MIVDRLDMNSINRNKELISLSIGDPTVFGNMDTDDIISQAVVKVTTTKRSNGYAHSCGYPHARKALAEIHRLPNYSDLNENVCELMT
jgi:tyrosine aminotransferase